MSFFRRRGLVAAFATMLVLFGGTSKAHAHEKWFLAGEQPDLALRGFLTPFCLSGVAVAAVVTLAGWFFWKRRQQRDLIPGPERLGATEAGLTRFYSLVPFILGMHFAVPLLVLGVQGKLFSPNNQPGSPWHLLIGTLEIAIALSFLYGGLTRLFATALGLLWVYAAASLGLEIALENLHYLGAAAFFYCTGRGPQSIDRMLFPALEPTPALARHALTALRVSLGLGFAFVAFSEKLANPALATAFLAQYSLNFTAALGIPLSDQTFIWCAGTAELLIGLFLAFGIFPRVIIVAAWGIINLTLTIFSWVELVGHLPIYGILAVLLIWAPSREMDSRWSRSVLGREG
jgi:hypothetical protein